MLSAVTAGYRPEALFHVKHESHDSFDPLTRSGFSAALGEVESSVLDRLEKYIGLLGKWQRAINLVGPRTLEDPWRRHILDSAQLIKLMGSEREAPRVVDLGSGAGLPGLIIAIMTDWPVTLVESDQRKATFLREAARETGTIVDVHAGRIEATEPLHGDIVTARALAPLVKLLPWVYRHLATGGKTMLLKGADVDDELTVASKQWTMDINRKHSVSDASGTVLVIENLRPLTDD
ncbi:MAG: 16S rRNA (guanine(527)-N(7))-methyltransferase RsmG [Rhodospirillales bacterium]